MNKTATFFCVTVVAITLSCSRIPSANPLSPNHTEIYESASETLPWAVQIEKIFGDSDHFITGLTPTETSPVWNTEVFFGGRYSLTMQVDVNVDYIDQKVMPKSDPVFYLFEFVEVVESGNGQVTSTIGKQMTFGLEEWRLLFQSSGDFSLIGFELNTQPTENFGKKVAAARKPRVKVTLGGEK